MSIAHRLAPASGITAFVALLLTAASVLYAEPPAPPLVRALWVKPAASADVLDTMVRSAAAAGFNALVVDVGRAYGFTPPDGDDPLARLVERAHGAGLRVHLAVDVLQATSPDEMPSSRDHVLYRHPDWLMVPRLLASSLLRVDLKSPEYFGALLRRARDAGTPVMLSPLQAPAVAAIIDAVGQIVARYPADGVHLLGLSLPDAEFDYSLAAVEEFTTEVRQALDPAGRSDLDARRAVDPFAYPAALPNDWLDFRARRVTTLLERLRAAIREHRPGAFVSASILPAADAPTARAQDWRSWVTSGLVDAVCATFGDTDVLSDEVTALTIAAAPSPVWVGIGTDRLSSRDAVDRAGLAGRSGAAGMILFSYDGLVGPSHDGQVLDEIGHSVFSMPRD